VIAAAVDPGTSLAITGPSGADKTAIARLLRMYDPADGGIRLDGVDLQSVLARPAH
jgi:ABC-type multidrug transport system fused ATPase/permease subunit